MSAARALLALLAAGAGCGGGGKPAPVAPDDDGGAAVAARGRRVPVESGDEEPSDGVEIQSSRGRMEPAVIEAGLEPHKDGLGACYTERVGKRRWLGGHVAIHWDIQRDGTISGVKLAESDLGAWPIEKCLLDIARAATFGKPIGGDADFSLPLDFSAKGRPSVWDEDRSVRAVGGQTSALDACAKAKGAKGPLPDDVTITVYVGPQGKPQSAGFSSAKSVLDDAWAECAEKAVLAWRLPDPRGEIAKLAVRYRAQ